MPRSSNQPGRLGAKTRPPSPCGNRRAVPIRSCSRRGLPCLHCYQHSGALLPHLFTLTPRTGRYILCGAIPQTARFRTTRPGVTRRLVSMEPGLSSAGLRPTRPSDRLAGEMCGVEGGRSRRGQGLDASAFFCIYPKWGHGCCGGLLSPREQNRPLEIGHFNVYFLPLAADHKSKTE